MNATNSLPEPTLEAIKAAGFVLLGIAPAVSTSGYDRLLEWIELGYAGDMDYIAKRKDAYRHPNGVLNGVKSIVCMALPYRSDMMHPVDARNATEIESGKPRGRLARYVWSGEDYHDVIHHRLKPVKRALSDDFPGANVRIVVDTAPLLEREFASLAGLGWQGKNTLLLNKTWGSYFFLASLLIDVDLEAATPFSSDHCGTCTACLDACPTDAFVEAGVLDARKCISYLTIEHRDAIPYELREGIGDWMFGCDVCQEVCPWNHKRSRHELPTDDFSGSWDSLDLCELFELDDHAFRKQFRKTPLWRSRRRGILRNAAIVLGNFDGPWSLEIANALTIGLTDDEAVVRGTSAWAIGRWIGKLNTKNIASAETSFSNTTDKENLKNNSWMTPQGLTTRLTIRLSTEENPDVRREIELALKMD